VTKANQTTSNESIHRAVKLEFSALSNPISTSLSASMYEWFTSYFPLETFRKLLIEQQFLCHYIPLPNLQNTSSLYLFCTISAVVCCQGRQRTGNLNNIKINPLPNLKQVVKIVVQYTSM